MILSLNKGNNARAYGVGLRLTKLQIYSYHYWAVALIMFVIFIKLNIQQECRVKLFKCLNINNNGIFTLTWVWLNMITMYTMFTITAGENKISAPKMRNNVWCAQNMYNRSITFKVILKATLYINVAIIDKQSSIN